MPIYNYFQKCNSKFLFPMRSPLILHGLLTHRIYLWVTFQYISVVLLKPANSVQQSDIYNFNFFCPIAITIAFKFYILLAGQVVEHILIILLGKFSVDLMSCKPDCLWIHKLSILTGYRNSNNFLNKTYDV